MSDSEIIFRHIMRNAIDTVLAIIRKIGQGHNTMGFRDLLLTDPGRAI